MRWRQFFTPVKSMDAVQAKEYINRHGAESYRLLDVRQPGEYEAGHIPGARLIPLPDLPSRLEEIDRDIPLIVYCAVGGRSRVAAQMLSGQGFEKVYNLTGGFKAWHSARAIGREDLGMELFSGHEAPEEILVAAYALEEGLRDFYLSMASQIAHVDARNLFEKLALIEVKHQDRIFDEYRRLTGSNISREAFNDQIVVVAVEGGLTTEEYLQRFETDLASVVDIVELAMSIEAQALDLYQRVADRSTNQIGREALLRIAAEERAHLVQLGNLL